MSHGSLSGNNFQYIWKNLLKRCTMKKLFLLTTAAFLFTGAAFAHEGEGGKKKKCAKGKSSCSSKKSTA